MKHKYKLPKKVLNEYLKKNPDKPGVEQIKVGYLLRYRGAQFIYRIYKNKPYSSMKTPVYYIAIIYNDETDTHLQSILFDQGDTLEEAIVIVKKKREYYKRNPFVIEHPFTKTPLTKYPVTGIKEMRKGVDYFSSEEQGVISAGGSWVVINDDDL